MDGVRLVIIQIGMREVCVQASVEVCVQSSLQKRKDFIMYVFMY